MNHRQINYNNYSNIEVDKFIAKEEARTNYQNMHDLTYNVDNNDYNEDENAIYGLGSSTVIPPEQTYLEPILSETNNWDRPAYGVANLPSVYPPINVIKHKDHLIHLQKNSIDWRKIGLLALIKFGLLKLKANSFLSILLLLLFKFKLFVMAIFLKSLFILKLTKVFVSTVYPLLFLQLMPKLMQILYTVLNPTTLQIIQSAMQMQPGISTTTRR